MKPNLRPLNEQVIVITGASRWDVLHRQGTLHVVRQPPPEARSVTVIDRAKALAESVAS